MPISRLINLFVPHCIGRPRKGHTDCLWSINAATAEHRLTTCVDLPLVVDVSSAWLVRLAPDRNKLECYPVSAQCMGVCIRWPYQVFSSRLVSSRMNWDGPCPASFAGSKTNEATGSLVIMDAPNFGYTTNTNTHWCNAFWLCSARYICCKSVKPHVQHALSWASSRTALCECNREYRKLRTVVWRTIGHYSVSFLT